MPLLAIHCVTINAVQPHTLATFWAALAGGDVREAGNSFVLLEPDGPGVRLLFQQADAPSPAPGWIHLDCAALDRDAAVAEITRLGGRVVERRSDSNGDWIVMADPEGNPFCL